jgi:hypothetical protein
MAIGTSGRLVVELEPQLKQDLHKAIKRSGKTLKEWLEEKAKQDFPEIFPAPPKGKK